MRKSKLWLTIAAVIISIILIAIVFEQTNLVKKAQATYPVTLNNIVFPSSESKGTLIMIGIF